MTYRFKISVQLCGKDYRRGDHEVPESVECHPYFLKLVKCGHVEEITISEVISPESLKLRNERLVERINKKAKALKDKIEADAKAKAEIKVLDDAPEDKAAWAPPTENCEAQTDLEKELAALDECPPKEDEKAEEVVKKSSQSKKK